jgi:hypothetical protein
MTDFEYIVQQVKKFHFTGWDDEELRKCVDLLPGLTREQQIALFRSKWVEHEKTLKEAIFNLLFKERIEERDRKIKAMSVNGHSFSRIHWKQIGDDFKRIYRNQFEK